MKITHDFHIHTNLSMCAKGKADFEGYMETFEKMGHTKVGFSDHFWDNDVPIDFDSYTPRNRITRFYTEQGFDHVTELLPKIRSYRGPVKISFGVEAEYDPFHHGVGITEAVAEQLDHILVPNSHTHMMMPIEFYEPYEKHAEYMINAYLEIMRCPVGRYVTAMAHPFEAVCCPYDNRILIDMIPDDTYRRLFDEQAERGIAFEINVSYMKNLTHEEIEQSSKMRVFRLAKECGCKFLFGSDAHDHATLAKYGNADFAADLLGLTEDDIADIAKF